MPSLPLKTLLTAATTITSLLIQFTSAQNFTASTCISSIGFNTCMATANSYLETCLANANGDQNKITACGCVSNLDEINCALENCWNVVYGCEYQDLVVNYNAYCSGDAVPFFPAPDNAPGGCSCNLGYVYRNFTNALTGSSNCITTDITRNDACLCCQQAIGYTAIYDICPQVNPNYFQAVDLLAEVLVDDDPQISQCGQYFNQYNCVSDLGYSAVGSLPYLTSIPATTGTLSYSTTSGSITTPLSGATFTWTALGQDQVITAAQATRSGSSSSAKSTTGSSSTTHSSAAAGGSTQSTGVASSNTASGAMTTASHSAAAHQARTWQSSGVIMVIFAAFWSV